MKNNAHRRSRERGTTPQYERLQDMEKQVWHRHFWLEDMIEEDKQLRLEYMGKFDHTPKGSSMSTAYTIEVGYNSVYSRDVVWNILAGCVSQIQGSPQRIICEVLRLEPDADLELVTEVAERYRKPVQDLTIEITDDGEDRRWVMQVASGGGSYRNAKESCRRAVCRLLLEEMHKRKMEINIRVS